MRANFRLRVLVQLPELGREVTHRTARLLEILIERLHEDLVHVLFSHFTVAFSSRLRHDCIRLLPRLVLAVEYFIGQGFDRPYVNLTRDKASIFGRWALSELQGASLDSFDLFIFLRSLLKIFESQNLPLALLYTVAMLV